VCTAYRQFGGKLRLWTPEVFSLRAVPVDETGTFLVRYSTMKGERCIMVRVRSAHVGSDGEIYAYVLCGGQVRRVGADAFVGLRDGTMRIETGYKSLGRAQRTERGSNPVRPGGARPQVSLPAAGGLSVSR
jgi:hypothetical protein